MRPEWKTRDYLVHTFDFNLLMAESCFDLFFCHSSTSCKHFPRDIYYRQGYRTLASDTWHGRGINLDTSSLPIYQSPLLSSRDTVSTYEALSIIRKPAYHHFSVRWSDKQIRNRFLDFYLMFTRYLHPNYFNISGVCLIDAWSLVITSDDNTYGTEERHKLRENIDLSIKPP